MRRLKCRSCKATLPKRRARCRNCGWAADYGSGDDRRERKLLVGIGLMAVGLSMALALAIAVPYLRSF
jgi:hypothetical protein